jgi:hypothetical protein
MQDANMTMAEIGQGGIGVDLIALWRDGFMLTH